MYCHWDDHRIVLIAQHAGAMLLFNPKHQHDTSQLNTGPVAVHTTRRGLNRSCHRPGRNTFQFFRQYIEQQAMQTTPARLLVRDTDEPAVRRANSATGKTRYVSISSICKENVTRTLLYQPQTNKQASTAGTHEKKPSYQEQYGTNTNKSTWLHVHETQSSRNRNLPE